MFPLRYLFNVQLSHRVKNEMSIFDTDFPLWETENRIPANSEKREGIARPRANPKARIYRFEGDEHSTFQDCD